MKKTGIFPRIHLLLLLLAGGALSFSGCVRNSLSDCHFPLRLRFEYIYNRENCDLFDAELDTLHLFLYESVSGRLVDTQSPALSSLSDDNTFEWYVPRGNYRVVAWAGNKGRYTYFSPEKFDAASVFVHREENGYHVNQCHEHLFHAITENIHITGTKHRPYTLSFRKNTNNIRIELVGLGSPGEISCEILGDNGAYDFRNRIVDEHSSCCYLPKDNTAVGAEEVWKDFTVLRLWKGDLSRLKVSYTDRCRVSDPLLDVSLSGLITSRNPNLDLDLDDEFLIRIERTGSGDIDTGLKITVNGWDEVEGGGSLG